MLSRFVSDPVWYFCLFWLPGYLQEESKLTLAQIGIVGWIPFLFADLGGVGSSMASDRLVKRGFVPICILTPHLPHAAVTLAIFSVVGAVCLTWLFNLGVVVAETFPAANVGSVWGIAGACGAAGARFFNSFVGEVMESFGPTRVFAVMALLHPLAAVILWFNVRPERPPEKAGLTNN